MFLTKKELELIENRYCVSQRTLIPIIITIMTITSLESIVIIIKCPDL